MGLSRSTQHSCVPYARVLPNQLCTDPELADTLFIENPFSESPPQAIRVMGYRYDMTDRETRDANGAYWIRRQKGLLVRPRSCGPDSTEAP